MASQPPTLFVPRGTVTKQINTFDILVGANACMLKIEYAPIEHILDLSKFQQYLSTPTDTKINDLSSYCRSLHQSLKTALATKNLKVKVEATLDNSTTMCVECKFKLTKKRPKQTASGSSKRRAIEGYNNHH